MEHIQGVSFEGYEIIQINENTWRIEEEMVRFFLLTGSEKALVIDTGMNVGKAREAAEQITSLPLLLLNTHGDRDHIGSDSQFSERYMNKNEEENYHLNGGKGKIIPVTQGDKIDLGGRVLEIIEIPGHTPGSIGVYDCEKRFLISGDPIQDGGIFMFGKMRNLSLYIEGLKALTPRLGSIGEIYPSHGSFPVKPSLVSQLILGAEKILSGEIAGINGDMFGNPIRICDIGCAKLFCDPKEG